MTSEQIFLKYSADKLTQLAGRIATCLDQLTPEQVWTRNSENENAIGNLVLHLTGNLRQWIGFGVAGKPDIRVRDREFTARGGIEAGDLKDRLLGITRETVAIITSLPPERLTEVVTVQSYEVTVLEAIYHVVEHFSGHTGQILFATKLWTGSDLGFYRHLSTPPHSEQVP
jgi:uncharacterized damage-inducible protein DinB